MIDEATKKRIQATLNVFETGSPEGDYSNISIFADGPGGKRQITYGKSQTTQYGNLKTLLEMYASAGGQYSSQLAPYASKMGDPNLVNNAVFKDLLKKAGKDPVMKSTQDEFFDKVYWSKAYNWFVANGFTKPLSMAVIFDSFIHSGSIRDDIRAKFAAVPPVRGGNEELWVTEYVNARHNWLANHSRTILHNTVYRTNFFKKQIAAKNWSYDCPLVANGTKVC